WPTTRSEPVDFDSYAIAAGFDPATLSDAQRSALLSGWKHDVGQQIIADAATDIQAMFEDAARDLEQYPSTKARVEAGAGRAKAGGWDRQRCELELLRARRPQASEINTMPQSVPSDLAGKMSEAALLLAHGVPSKTVAGWYGEQVTDRATSPQARNV